MTGLAGLGFVSFFSGALYLPQFPLQALRNLLVEGAGGDFMG